MAFINTRLSARAAYGFTGGPEWKTLVVPMMSGRNNRRAEWSMPHHRYTADYTVLDPIAQNEILDAFIVCRGQLHNFRYKDWNDYLATDQAMAVGDGTSTPRFLTKTYTFGGQSYVRTITLPVVSTLVITANGAPIAVTFDADTGKVTPDAPWPNGQVIKASFEFDVRVRFGDDFVPFTRNSPRTATAEVSIVEDWPA